MYWYDAVVFLFALIIRIVLAFYDTYKVLGSRIEIVNPLTSKKRGKLVLSFIQDHNILFTLNVILLVNLQQKYKDLLEAIYSSVFSSRLVLVYIEIFFYCLTLQFKLLKCYINLVIKSKLIVRRLKVKSSLLNFAPYIE